MVNRSQYSPKVKTDKLGAACMVLVFYFIFEYVRPQYSLLPVLSYLKVPMILSLILFVFFLKSDKKMLKDRLVIYTILFIAEIALSVTYAVNSFYVWNTFFGMVIILFAVILVMPVICDSKARLMTFVNIWILIHVVVALYALFHSGRGPGGFLLDENDLSLTLNMALPMTIYLSMSPNISKLRRNYYRIVSLMFVVTVGVTMSRGGFLGLLSVAGLTWLLSKSKVKSLFGIIVIVAILGYPVYKMIPETYITEMSTITNTSDSTRLERQYFWTKGWEMFLDNPVLGVGAANYPWNIAQYQMRDPEFDPNTMLLFGGRPAHSMYFTLIPELGVVGIVIFLLILYEIFKRLINIVRLDAIKDSSNDDVLLSKALIISAGTYLVTGAFISVLYYPPFWYLIGFVLTLSNLVFAEKSKEVCKECHPAM